MAAARTRLMSLYIETMRQASEDKIRESIALTWENRTYICPDDSHLEAICAILELLFVV